MVQHHAVICIMGLISYCDRNFIMVLATSVGFSFSMESRKLIMTDCAPFGLYFSIFLLIKDHN